MTGAALIIAAFSFTSRAPCSETAGTRTTISQELPVPGGAYAEPATNLQREKPVPAPQGLKRAVF